VKSKDHSSQMIMPALKVKMEVKMGVMEKVIMMIIE
jgi:hypothetical protein